MSDRINDDNDEIYVKDLSIKENPLFKGSVNDDDEIYVSSYPNQTSTDYYGNINEFENRQIPLSGFEGLRKRRAIDQSTGEQVGIAAKNLIPNIGLGIIENAGYLLELPNAIFTDKKDFSNAITEWAKDSRNPLGGEIYRENPEAVWDIWDGAWWTEHGSGLFESIGEFLVTGAGVGKALGSGAKALTQAIGKKSLNAAGQGLAQIGTASTLAYVEGAMSGAEIYKQSYDDAISRGLSDSEANQIASKAAAKTVRLNTTVNTFLNMTGIAPLFNKNAGIFSSLGLNPIKGELPEQAYKRVSNKLTELTDAGIVNPNLKGKLLFETLQEGLEEQVNLASEMAGKLEAGLITEEEAGGKTFAEIFAKQAGTEEGLLNFTLGAIGGAGQTTGINLLTRKQQLASNKFQHEQEIAAVESGRDVLEKMINYQENLKEATDKNDIENIKKYRFLLNNTLNEFHVRRGTSSLLKEVYETLANTDNRKLPVDEITSQIEQLEQQRREILESDNVTQQAVDEINEQIVQLKEQAKTPEVNQTEAMRLGLAKSKEDNSYLEQLRKKAADIKKYEDSYRQYQEDYNYTEEAERLNVAGEVLKREATRDGMSQSLNMVRDAISKARESLHKLNEGWSSENLYLAKKLEAINKIIDSYSKIDLSEMGDFEKYRDFNTTDDAQIEKIIAKRIKKLNKKSKQLNEHFDTLQEGDSTNNFKSFNDVYGFLAIKDEFEELVERETNDENLFEEAEDNLNEITGSKKVRDAFINKYVNQAEGIRKDIQDKVSKSENDSQKKINNLKDSYKRNSQKLQALDEQERNELQDLIDNIKKTDDELEFKLSRISELINKAKGNFKPDVVTDDDPEIIGTGTENDPAEVVDKEEEEEEEEEVVDEAIVGSVDGDVLNIFEKTYEKSKKVTSEQVFKKEGDPDELFDESEQGKVFDAYNVTNQSAKEEISDQIKDDYPQILLIPNAIEVGDELVYEIWEDAVDKDTGVNLYEEYKDNPSMIPIKITHSKSGQIIGSLRTQASVDNVNNVRKSHYYEGIDDNIAYQKELNMMLRNYILENNGEVKLQVGNILGDTVVSNSKTVREAVPFNDRVSNPDVRVGIFGNKGVYVKGDVIKPINMSSEFVQNKYGYVFGVFKNVKGKEVALPLILSQLGEQEEILNVIVDALDAFVSKGELNPELVELLKVQDLNVDITTEQGMNDFLGSLIHVNYYNNTNIDKIANETSKSGRYIYVRNHDGVNKVYYQENGDPSPTEFDLDNQKEELISFLSKIHFNALFGAINNPQFPVVRKNEEGEYNVQKENYESFLKSIVKTTIVENRPVDANGKTHYSYFDNPLYYPALPKEIDLGELKRKYKKTRPEKTEEKKKPEIVDTTKKSSKVDIAALEKDPNSTVVSYKGNEYVVYFDNKEGKIYNRKSGKSIKPTSSVGKNVLNRWNKKEEVEEEVIGSTETTVDYKDVVNNADKLKPLNRRRSRSFPVNPNNNNKNTVIEITGEDEVISKLREEFSNDSEIGVDYFNTIIDWIYHEYLFDLFDGLNSRQSKENIKRYLRDEIENSPDESTYHVKLILDNFDNLSKLAEDKLLSLNNDELILIEDKLNEVESEGREDNTILERKNFDDWTFSSDPKFRLNLLIKNILSTIQDKNGEGELDFVYHLGLQKYIPFDIVYNTIKSILADSDPDYDSMMEKLKEHSSSIYWLDTVVEVLGGKGQEFIPNHVRESKNFDFGQLKNSFASSMSNYQYQFENIRYEIDEDGSIGSRVINSDRNANFKLVLRTWMENVKRSYISDDSDLNFRLDKEKLEEVKKRYKEIEKIYGEKTTTVEQRREFINEFLGYFNIELHESTVEYLLTNAFKNIPVSQLFKNPNSPFKRIRNSLNDSGAINLSETFEGENPLFRHPAVSSLAYLEAINNGEIHASSFINIEDKRVVSINLNRMMFKRLQELQNNLNPELLQIPFNQIKDTRISAQFQWLPNIKLGKESFPFDLKILDGSEEEGNFRSKKKTIKFTERDQEIASVSGFLTGINKKKQGDKKVSSEFYHFIPSKRITVAVNAPLISFNRDNESSLDFLYAIVESEINRINADIDFFDNTKDKFLIFDTLNDVIEDLRNSEGKLVLDETLIKEKLLSELDSMVDEKIETWERLKLIEDNKFKIKQGKRNITDLKGFTENYLVNQIWFQYNMMQSFTGDIAQYKMKGSIDSLWDDMFKRLTKDISPGVNLAIDKNNTHYLQVSLEDVNIGQDEYFKNLKDYDSTDAQEYTTAETHLFILKQLGRISQRQFDELLDKANKGLELTLDEEELFEPVTFYLDPSKPIARDNIIIKDGNTPLTEVTGFVKSSSIPLIPHWTKDLPIDNLRIALEKLQSEGNEFSNNKKILVRASFASANKIKFTEENLNIFDKETGKVKENIEIPKTATQRFNWKGFAVQEELKRKENKIIDGTQQRKIILSQMSFIEKRKAEDILSQYGQIYEEIFQQNYQALRDSLYEDDTLDIKKLSELLIDEAKKRSWNKNDIKGLETELVNGKREFIFPINLNNSQSRIEALLTSVVNNNIIRHKRRGGSFALMSAEGWNGYSSNWTYTDNFDGELKPMRVNEKGEVLPAQVIVPQYLFDSLPTTTKEIEEDGKKRKITVIDSSKVDDKIFKALGFRIPTQTATNSIMSLEVVGFLPKSWRNTVIAPRQFVAQMGSDFDIDKLNIFTYETEQTEKVVENAPETITDIKSQYDDIRLPFIKKKDIDLNIKIDLSKIYENASSQFENASDTNDRIEKQYLIYNYLQKCMKSSNFN